MRFPDELPRFLDSVVDRVRNLQRQVAEQAARLRRDPVNENLTFFQRTHIITHVIPPYPYISAPLARVVLGPMLMFTVSVAINGGLFRGIFFQGIGKIESQPESNSQQAPKALMDKILSKDWVENFTKENIEDKVPPLKLVFWFMEQSVRVYSKFCGIFRGVEGAQGGSTGNSGSDVSRFVGKKK